MKAFSFLDPSLIDKRDVSMPGYRVYDVFTNRRGTPVVIQQSQKSDPHHWLVLDGTCTMFFLTYHEVADYIRSRGLVPTKHSTTKTNF